VYDAVAARESEVGGKILFALEGSGARPADATASGSLRVARHQASLIEIAREKGLRFERGLTLGCGAGRLERSLLEHGICQSFHGIDISEKAVADAQETAKRNGLPLTYEIGDLNLIELPRKAHHVLFLERIAEKVWGTLMDKGYLWIHDFIGGTQYDPKRLDIINRLLSISPENFARTESITR
jgi:hypothetical protein